MEFTKLMKSGSAILLLLVAMMTLVISCKRTSEKAAEKFTEKVMEKASGGDADVDIEDGKITIETKDGKITAEEVKTWPKGISDEVPEFKYGKLINALTQEFPDGLNYTVSFEEVAENALNLFKKDLERKGFEIESTVMIGTSGNVSAQKGNLVVVIMSGDGMATLSVVEKKET